MNKHLMGTIVEVLFFLESSDDAVLDPDVAVAQTEQIVAFLDKLDADEKSEFAAYIDTYAASERASGSSQKRIDFFGGLASAIGLRD